MKPTFIRFFTWEDGGAVPSPVVLNEAHIVSAKWVSSPEPAGPYLEVQDTSGIFHRFQLGFHRSEGFFLP